MIVGDKPEERNCFIMATTPSQIEANRRNATHSTGPSTPEGKARASQNARKHGLSGAQLHIASPEEQEVYEDMSAALREAILPLGELEETLFDQALYAQWNLRLCRLREAELLAACAADASEQNEAKLLNVDRYLRRHESSYQRALRELRILQTDRAFDDLVSAPPNEPIAGEPVPVADVMKARRAFLLERAHKSKINARNLRTALEQLVKDPNPTAHIEYSRFDQA